MEISKVSARWQTSSRNNSRISGSLVCACAAPLPDPANTLAGDFK